MIIELKCEVNSRGIERERVVGDMVVNRHSLVTFLGSSGFTFLGSSFSWSGFLGPWSATMVRMLTKIARTIGDRYNRASFQLLPVQQG